jgi:redox-sensitive bicupin YhaK (pirin superfamily)
MIRPGAVNWMVAGRGVTHSERTSAEMRRGVHPMFGIQTWVALPEHAEDAEPAFEHHAKDALPFLEGEGKEVRLILGTGWGARAPATVLSETVYADAIPAPGAKLPLPDEHEDRGLYIVAGSVAIAGETFEAGRMMVFRPGDRITVTAGDRGARRMVLGGATLNGPRYIWWNFVASSRERIEAAKAASGRGDWADNPRFRLPPGDEAEFIPLPDR